MSTRIGPLSLALLLSACAGRGPAPLAFAVPGEVSVTYAYADTTDIAVTAMGQSLPIGIRSEARYSTSLAPDAGGTEVTMRVETLSSVIEAPMAGAQTASEADVDGALVFLLDRRGRATVVSEPRVSPLASRVISGLVTAHTFFPRLPDRVVAPGDHWADTVSFGGDMELGPYRETSVYRYEVVGDTAVAGTMLLHIAVSGTTEVDATFAMGDMSVAQVSNLEITGSVLWDAEAGIVVEYTRRGSGSGRARVSEVPLPLPLQVEVFQRAYVERE